LGETLDGRLAFIVFRRSPGGVIRVITARDMDNKERRLLRRKQVDRMKEELPSAKAALPGFRSDKEVAEYFETHSVEDVWIGEKDRRLEIGLYQTQLRMWIAEGIQREMKGRQPMSRVR
jgi:hypothetical protein